MLEAKELVQECLAKTIQDDSAASACLERLTASLSTMAKGFKEGLMAQMALKKTSEEAA